jgi:hypothetical protein
MGRNLLLSKGGQAGIKADFFILDTELFSDVVPVKNRSCFPPDSSASFLPHLRTGGAGGRSFFNALLGVNPAALNPTADNML